MNAGLVGRSERSVEQEVAAPVPQVGWLSRTSSNDWLVLIYLVFLDLQLVGVPSSEAKTQSVNAMLGLTFLYVIAVFVGVRARFISGPATRAFIYRTAQLIAVQGTYFAFAKYLPIVNPVTFDRELHAMDLKWFGIEPAFFFDQFVTPVTTEWFAFFYYGYFFLIASHLLPIMYLGKQPLKTAQFLLGILLVTTIGQATYVLVPGFGPHVAFPEMFTRPLPSGIWWRIVTDLVNESGAQKDIFPSLHTAIPGYILLYSYHQRDHYPYRLTWHFVAFSVFNIVIATMFLRWHYFIDVVAGLLLAGFAYAVSTWLPIWERRVRQERGAGEIWPTWREG